MIKVYKGKFTRESYTIGMKGAYYKRGEQALIYQGGDYHNLFIGSKPRNAKVKESNTVIAGIAYKGSFNIRLDDFAISEVLYVKNKKELKKLIDEFNYEKGL